MAEESTPCSPGSAFNKLFCIRIEAPEHVDIEKQIFLISQLPCCANLALPYWGKIVGDIINNGSEEKLLSIEAIILDLNDHPICSYEDYMALESGSTGGFEIKILHHNEQAKAYSLVVREAREF